MPMNSVAERPPLDARVSGLPPERAPQPAPPLRLTMEPESDGDDMQHARLTLRYYVQRFGAERVLDAVKQIAGGAQ